MVDTFTKLSNENLAILSEKEIQSKALELISGSLVEVDNTSSLEEISEFINSAFKNFDIRTSVSDCGTSIEIDRSSYERLENLFETDINYLGVEENALESLNKIGRTIRDRNIPVLVSLENLESKWYVAKQWAFMGGNFIHCGVIQSQTARAASLSKTGGSPIGVGSIVAISFASSVLLSLVETHVPNGNIKNAIRGAKIVIGIPTAITQYVTNGFFGVVEKSFRRKGFPINATDVLGITNSPNLTTSPAFRKRAGDWLLKIGRWLNDNQ
jgi:hypothetical protein